MTLNCDPEILQDFLVEAGELLERLQEQLVELETKPDDRELLNAIFRGFHTVKGGAGFLALTNMVDVCHVTENVFDVLRQGKRKVTSGLMDVVLQALDSVNSMFKQVRNSEDPSGAEPELLEKLAGLTVPEVTAVELEQTEALQEDYTEGVELVQTTPLEVVEKSAPGFSTKSDEITDEEFERLLDEIGTSKDTAPETLFAPEPVKAVELAKVEPIVRAPIPTPLSQTAHVVKEMAAIVNQPADTTVRVDTSRLDDIMNMVGELVLVRNRLVTLGAATSDENMSQAVANLDVVTADLQMAVMKTRMQPIKKVFGRFPRVVRDLARTLKKDITLELVGEETDLDKNLVEALADPLVHLVRNSVDHGIEMPDVRVANGKPKQGKIILSAEQAGDHILLSISDDGGGMDPDKLRYKAVEKGLMDKDIAERLNEKECFNLIFMPGFSTKSEISDISGRGVGMDVVKTKIAQLNGVTDVQSALGRGTTISIKVPLTLAILPTLMVVLGQQTFALPLTSVNEIFHLDLTKTNVVDGQLVVVVRDKALPLFYLKKWLLHHKNLDISEQREGHVVIVTVGTKRIGFVVDQLVGQEEVVIKPLGQMLQGTPGMAGATITGDGRIAMILDIPGLLKCYAKNR